MNEQACKIIADLETLLLAFRQPLDLKRRECLQIAYAYRLTQLETYGLDGLYRQYSTRYEHLVTKNEVKV
jgi:hypothetical protein